jgi:hypothetical protein
MHGAPMRTGSANFIAISHRVQANDLTLIRTASVTAKFESAL